MDQNDFHYVAVLLDMFYGIELEDQDIEELGLLAWNMIGNKNFKLYRIRLCINPIDNSVTLPCNALENGGEVELVTASWEDWERDTNKDSLGNPYTSFVEQGIESQKLYQSPWYMPGKVLKYERVGDKLYFTHNYGTVNVLYKGIFVDEEGLPKITDKEASAIAAYIAWTQKFKESLMTNNRDILTQAEYLKNQWLKMCDQARVTYLNQNDYNNILDIAKSWGRHSYGKGGTKPIR